MLTQPLVLGIDPGYDRLGWAVGELTKPKIKVVACGCIETDRQADFYDRLKQIVHGINRLTTEYHLQAAAMETLFFGRNQSTAIPVAQARGAVVGQLLQQAIPIFEYNPAQVKLAVTGYGKADKAAVAKLTKMQVSGQLPEKLLDDTLDAIALLITHSACIVR